MRIDRKLMVKFGTCFDFLNTGDCPRCFDQVVLSKSSVKLYDNTGGN